ncbi:MAG: hypothetical protein L3J20_07955 [Flavobacteriaceae bacterium]|nr:hypothetical protein [Flavobacteriaceae bacterium]
MPGGNLDTGNPIGNNSHIYGSYQGDDFAPGGGARIPFMKHLPNALSYLKKGLRDVTGAMD